MDELPAARGHTTDALLKALRERPHHLAPIELPDGTDPLGDDDLQLALYLCYELHYRGLPRVDERWEWSPSLLALRQALERLHPQLASFELVDYKVRILEGAHGTGAVTRVLVRTSDGDREWDTVGVDENVIAASWQALEDAYTFGLMQS